MAKSGTPLKAPLKGALVQIAQVEDDAQYHIAITRQIMNIDGRPIRPGDHLKQVTMRGAIVKQLAEANPGAISAIERA